MRTRRQSLGAHADRGHRLPALPPDPQAYAIQNAIYEKVAGGLNYLGLTWATVVILSGHASVRAAVGGLWPVLAARWHHACPHTTWRARHARCAFPARAVQGLDTYDFYVVTVILLASATRALLVQLRQGGGRREVPSGSSGWRQCHDPQIGARSWVHRLMPVTTPPSLPAPPPSRPQLRCDQALAERRHQQRLGPRPAPAQQLPRRPTHHVLHKKRRHAAGQRRGGGAHARHVEGLALRLGPALHLIHAAGASIPRCPCAHLGTAKHHAAVLPACHVAPAMLPPCHAAPPCCRHVMSPPPCPVPMLHMPCVAP